MSDQKGKRTGRIKHQQGLADFLRLGPDRSLEKLYFWYTENVPKPPAISTLKIWSTRYGWQAKAAAHDARVASRVAEKAEKAAVEETWDQVKALTVVARKTLQKVVDGLEGESIKADDAYQLAALTNSALAAIKGVQLLTGGPTERIGYTVKDSAPEWMAERLKAPAPGPSPTAAATSDENEDTTIH